MNKLLTILVSTLLLGACVKDKAINEQPVNNILLNLQISSLAGSDPMSIHQDETFASMAIYIYDNSEDLEQSALSPAFSLTNTKEIPIRTKEGTKSIYVIANYVGKSFKRTNGTTFTLSGTTTKQELENIITESSGGFLPNSLLMVGKQAMTVTDADNGQLIDVILRRLQARIDVHVYKGSNFISNAVTLQSVELHSQILNSEVKFDYAASSPQMPTSPMFNNQILSNNTPLSGYINGTVLDPTNAQAIFYSYQNLVTASFPMLQTTTPYLEIKIMVDGIGHTYKGYLTDDDQIFNKYSLLQNNLYQVKAILDTNSKISFNLNVLPWDKTNIEYERPITANDFSFGAWGTSWGGLSGNTMNTNGGGIEDAVFEFELKAPIGAVWVASLTNGLDFSFTSSTAGTTTQAVSSDFANVGSPRLIAVRASKRWTGISRDTEFYITVQGNEIPINPVIGSGRKYQGTDTRIKIKQVASHN